MIYGGKKSYSLVDLAETVEVCVAGLKDKKFDAIVVRGVSGLVVGSPVALALKKPLIVVRKDGESAHSTKHPGIDAAKDAKVLFLDDFVSSGTTRRTCALAVVKAGGKVVAQFSYNRGALKGKSGVHEGAYERFKGEQLEKINRP